MKNFRVSCSAQTGAAVVEFAFLLPVMLLLAVGIMEYGRAVYQYDTLTKSARSAVRYLSQYAAGDAAAIGVAQNLALCGLRDCANAAPLVPGLTTGHVAVCDASSCAGTQLGQQTGSGTLNLVTVTISGYSFDRMLPALTPAITFGPIQASMRQGS